MLELLKDLLLVSLGGGIGVMLMCLLIAGKQGRVSQIACSA